MQTYCVSHGAPRQHFPGKQALLDALTVPGLKHLGGEIGERPVDTVVSGTIHTLIHGLRPR
jgi:hypothetical protein